MSYHRQRQCWLVGLVYTQGLQQCFTHIHELGLPSCCRSCYLLPQAHSRLHLSFALARQQIRC